MAKNTKNMQSEQANSVIQMMTVLPSKLKSTDIDEYRNAINQAKLGYPSKWFELCDNLMADGFLRDQRDKLVSKVTNAELQFQVDGKPVDVINEIIDTPEFEDLLTEIVYSKFYGKSVVNTSFVPEFSIFSFPRKNLITRNVLRPISEKENLIVEREGMVTGYNYSNDEFILEFGKDGDLGIMFSVAQYAIYKRGNFGDWAEWAEIFGRPFVLGKYNSTDVNAREQLFISLAEIGGKPVAAVPKETDIEVIQASGTSKGELYELLRKACNEEMMIGVLGETMTTVSGSSRSQSETHQDTLNDKAKALCRYAQRMLNKKLVPLLAKRGYPVAGGKFVFPDAKADISVENLISLSKVMKIPAKFAHEKFAIPMAEEGEETLGSSPVNPTDPKNTPPEPPTPPVQPQNVATKKENHKKLKLSDSEKGFLRMCVDFFANARTLGSRAISSVLNLADKSTNYTAGIDINGIFEDALKDIYAKHGIVDTSNAASSVSKPLFDITNKTLQKGIDKTFSVEFGKTDPEFIQQFKENAAVFSAFKAHKQGNEIVAQLIDENGNLRSYYDFRKAVLGTTIAADYNENWLKTEYNMAVRSARMAERFKGFLKTAHIYPNLKYLPSRSAHPRDAHKPFYGVILSIFNAWWNTHMPPSEWGCECDVENTDEPETAVPEDEEPIDPVFANNPGVTAEFINIKEHPYAKEVTDEEVLNSIIEFAKFNVDDEWGTIKTKNGLLRVSDAHGKQERSDNVKLATYFANKYGYEIDLLATDNNKKTADSLNKTLGIEQEYKHNIKATVSAIDNELRKGKSQADHIVLNIESKIKLGDLVNGIKGRVQRAENIKTVWVKIGKFDRQYTREEILSPGWKIQRD